MKETLTKKLGPLPVWAWFALVAVAVVVFFRSRTSAATAATAGAPSSSTDLVAGTGQSDQGGAPPTSGISPDILASLLGPDSALQTTLARLYGGAPNAAGTTGSSSSSSASGAGDGTSTLSSSPITPSIGTAALGGPAVGSAAAVAGDPSAYRASYLSPTIGPVYEPTFNPTAPKPVPASNVHIPGAQA